VNRDELDFAIERLEASRTAEVALTSLAIAAAWDRRGYASNELRKLGLQLRNELSPIDPTGREGTYSLQGDQLISAQLRESLVTTIGELQRRDATDIDSLPASVFQFPGRRANSEGAATRAGESSRNPGVPAILPEGVEAPPDSARQAALSNPLPAAGARNDVENAPREPEFEAFVDAEIAKEPHAHEKRVAARASHYHPYFDHTVDLSVLSADEIEQVDRLVSSYERGKRQALAP